MIKCYLILVLSLISWTAEAAPEAERAQSGEIRDVCGTIMDVCAKRPYWQDKFFVSIALIGEEDRRMYVTYQPELTMEEAESVLIEKVWTAGQIPSLVRGQYRKTFYGANKNGMILNVILTPTQKTASGELVPPPDVRVCVRGTVSKDRPKNLQLTKSEEDAVVLLPTTFYPYSDTVTSELFYPAKRPPEEFRFLRVEGKSVWNQLGLGSSRKK